MTGGRAEGCWENRGKVLILQKRIGMRFFTIRKGLACLVMMIAGGASVLLSGGCGSDSPERPDDIVTPDGPRHPGGNDGDENGSDSGEEEPDPEETSKIFGKWRVQEGSGEIEFESNGNFSATDATALGFHSAEATSAHGTYTYDDFKQWLWLSVNGESEVYVLEYNCRIEDGHMTLYDAGSHRTVLIRVVNSEE